MKQKWKKMQYVEISMDEIFCFQDKLDKVKNNPEEVWEVVDSFFAEAENQLELSPGFIKSLKEAELDNEFVELNLDKLEDFFPEDMDEEDYNDYVCLKAYHEYKKKLTGE